MYKIFYTKHALKQIEKKTKNTQFENKTKQLIEIIKNNPYQIPPPYEKLSGDFKGAYSRRINIKHRLVYEVFEELKAIKIVSVWTHYEL
jgi:Txe/YoeB family toxin of toxin-antitoxin system